MTWPGVLLIVGPFLLSSSNKHKIIDKLTFHRVSPYGSCVGRLAEKNLIIVKFQITLMIS